MEGKKGSKRIEMIIKMVNKFKLTVVHFARPNPMGRRARPLSLWVAGPSLAAGRWAFGPQGRCGLRPLGLRAAGPLQAAGLLLTKNKVDRPWLGPVQTSFFMEISRMIYITN